MCTDFDLRRYFLFFAPICVSQNVLCRRSFIFKALRFIVILHFFIWAVASLINVVSHWVVRGLLRTRWCLVKAFEDNICKFALHKEHIGIFKDASRFCLYDADVMDSSWRYTDHSFMHQRFHKSWSLLDLFDAVVVSTVEWRWRH